MDTASTAAVLFAFAFGLGLGTWLTIYAYQGQILALKDKNRELDEAYRNTLVGYTQYPRSKP